MDANKDVAPVTVNPVVVVVAPNPSDNSTIPQTAVEVKMDGALGVSEPELVAVTPDSNSLSAVQKTEDVKVETPTKEWTNVDSFKGASFNSTIINIVNTVIGAGVLSMGFCVRQGGLLGSVLLILAVVIPSQFTLYYCSAASLYTGTGVYGLLGKKLFNKAVGVLSDIFVILLSFGVCSAYMGITFQQTSDTLIDYCGVSEAFMNSNRWWVNLLMSLVIFFPLSSIKNMDNLKFTSAIALACIVVFVIATFGLGIRALTKENYTYNLWPDTTEHLGTAASVFVLSFCCHTNIPRLSDEVKHTSTSKFSSKLSKMNRIGIVSYILCAVSYLLVGAFGYFAFGNDINGSLLTSLRNSKYWFIPVIKVGYGLNTMLSFPLIAYVPTLSIDSMLFKSERTSKRRMTEAFLWVMLTYIVSQLVPELIDIFSITGSLCGSFIGFILPSLFYIRLCAIENAKPKDQQVKWIRKGPVSIAIAWIIMIAGAVVCVWATYMEIIGLKK